MCTLNSIRILVTARDDALLRSHCELQDPDESESAPFQELTPQ